MFGFNKKKRLIEGPVEFEAEVEIDRPAAEVFGLIDLASPQCGLVQRGAHVTRVEGADNDYRLTSEEFGDCVFHFHVIERVDAARHTVEVVMEPQLYALEKAIEAHRIEPISEEACRVKLTTSATFDPTLSDEEVAGEIAVMSEAVMLDLEKLKLLAEDGVAAVKEFEENQMGIEIDLDGLDLDFDWSEIEPEN
ncbi:MAG: SRPBCC family protein [Pseudomonadota bacterium]